MSAVYTGSPANVANSLAVNISGATNATPIVVQSIGSHGFQTGDLVNITGVNGNTACNNAPNNPWTVTFVDVTHFSLNSSTGNGTYTNGGVATDVSLTPAGTIPSDGDPRNAASVNVMLQLAADRDQFLAQRVGKYRLLNQYIAQLSDASGNEDVAAWTSVPSSWSATTTGAAGAWAQCTGAAGGVFGQAFTAPAPVCNQGDIFDISWETSCVTTTNSPSMFATFISLSGVSAGAYARVPGSSIYVSSLVTTAPIAPSRAIYTVAAGGNAQTFGFGIYVRTSNGATLTANLLGARSFVINHLRAN